MILPIEVDHAYNLLVKTNLVLFAPGLFAPGLFAPGLFAPARFWPFRPGPFRPGLSKTIFYVIISGGFRLQSLRPDAMDRGQRTRVNSTRVLYLPSKSDHVYFVLTVQSVGARGMSPATRV